QTVMTFISAWTSELHRLGYQSGVYGSSASLMVDMSRSVGSASFVAPDDVWFAHWNQLQTTSDASSSPGFPDAYWSNHARLHQYSGGFSQSWGGATVNIDANWVDASVAGTALPVDYGPTVVGPGGAGFVLTGSMSYWRSGAPAGLKGLAYWTYSNGSTEFNGATWSPQLSPGVYDVEVNIPSTNATANAPYTITDALGTTTRVVNQAAVSGYTSLGTYTALAGRPISVHVGDNDPSPTTTQIGVDAMAFRLVAAPPSSQESPVQRFITRVYSDLFNRAPDPNGLATWTNALNTGTPRVAVANAITSSTEYRSGLITGSYQHYLGRTPDPAGLGFWLGKMSSGWTISQMESGFIASAEYYAKAGSTPAGWVTTLYADVLGRTAGPSEVAFWTGQLAGGASRSQVAMGFLLSTERLSTVVNGYYQHLLGRDLDPAGQSTWVGILQAGGRNEAIIGGIIASQEYYGRV
ncbi:MAG TPA: DUF4214 domain-containing protein, partial [Cellulomonadaceae bacterium]|nr:DUF4214 domain-containing protein [Cellulomonadaceae bacterium]